MPTYDFRPVQDRELVENYGSLLQLSHDFIRAEEFKKNAVTTNPLVTEVVDPLTERFTDPKIYAEKKKKEYEERAYIKKIGDEQWSHPITSVGIGILNAVVDPTSWIPIVGPAKQAALVAKYGKIGGRAITGVTEGAVGNLLLEPSSFAAAERYNYDYSLADSVANTVFGGIAGGGLHVGFGAIGDAISKGRVSPEAHQTAMQTAASNLSENRTVDVSDVLKADYLARSPEDRAFNRAALKEEAFGPAQPVEIGRYLTEEQINVLTPDERTKLSNDLAGNRLFQDHSDLDINSQLALDRQRRSVIQTALGKDIEGDLKVTAEYLYSRTTELSNQSLELDTKLKATQEKLNLLDPEAKSYKMQAGKLNKQIAKLQSELVEKQGKIDSIKSELESSTAKNTNDLATLSKDEFVQEFYRVKDAISSDPALKDLSNLDLEKLTPEQRELLDRYAQYFNSEKLDLKEQQALEAGDPAYVKALYDDIQYKESFGKTPENEVRQNVKDKIINKDEASKISRQNELAGKLAEEKAFDGSLAEIEKDVTQILSTVKAYFGEDSPEVKSFLEKDAEYKETIEALAAAEEVAIRCSL